MWFKICLIYNSGGHFVRQSGSILAIFVEGVMRNISVNYFELGPVIQLLLNGIKIENLFSKRDFYYFMYPI